MKTKTIKTPLMMAVAFGPTSCPSGFVPKSELLHNPEDQYGFVPSSAIMVAKTSPFGLKNRFSHQSHTFFSGAQRNGVFSRRMSYVAEQCGAMSGLVRELAHRHKAMTAAQKLEELRHRTRGF